MVRPNAIFDDARNYLAERDWRSSDDFASLLAFAVFRRNLRHVHATLTICFGAPHVLRVPFPRLKLAANPAPNLRKDR
jgi:hypothetical protein